MKKAIFIDTFRATAMSVAALAGVASIAFLIATNPAAAATKGGGGTQPDSCDIDLGVCNKSCAGELDWCAKECEKKFVACKPTRSGSGPSSTKTGNHTSPTGGTKDVPKAPPKANDARAPLGDGVFHAKKPGADTSGPVLNSGGSPGSIQKPNGGGGSSFRSGDRR